MSFVKKTVEVDVKGLFNDLIEISKYNKERAYKGGVFIGAVAIFREFMESSISIGRQVGKTKTILSMVNSEPMKYIVIVHNHEMKRLYKQETSGEVYAASEFNNLDGRLLDMSGRILIFDEVSASKRFEVYQNLAILFKNSSHYPDAILAVGIQ